MGSLLNSSNLSTKTKLKSKSKSKYSDSSKAVANAESKLMKSANVQPKGMFLVRHKHYNSTLNYSIISIEGNSFRVLDEDDDDDDLPRNLLSLLRFKNNVFDVRGCCGSWIWLLHRETFPGVAPQDLVWDMETDGFTCGITASCGLIGSVWAYGFGFDPSSGHYKLVRCSWLGSLSGTYAEVFSLGASLWKAVHYPFGINVSPETHSSIHIKGFYYWIVAASIMTFDFVNDQFRALIPLPLPEKEYFWKLVKVALVEFQGSLAAVCCASEDNSFIFEIWAWNARGRFWSIVSIFDIPAAVAPRAVLNLCNNDKLFLEDSKGDLLLYNLATRQLQNLGLPIDRRWSSQFFHYVKSSVGHSSSS